MSDIADSIASKSCAVGRGGGVTQRSTLMLFESPCLALINRHLAEPCNIDSPKSQPAPVIWIPPPALSSTMSRLFGPQIPQMYFGDTDPDLL